MAPAAHRASQSRPSPANRAESAPQHSDENTGHDLQRAKAAEASERSVEPHQIPDRFA
ncbi:MAG UNVERIFIED_CONTAM: hypothetical protein LVR18_09235 [Planctomycetaceae bacterium]|jgi:hypothetical protein